MAAAQAPGKAASRLDSFPMALAAWLRRRLRDVIGWEPLRPRREITPEALERGLRSLLADGVASLVQGGLVTGAFLVALALALGASNAVIGLLAALPPLAQLLQLPAVVLVDRVSLRKALAVYSALASRLALLAAVVVLAVMAETSARIAVLVVGLALHHGLSAVGGCAFNPWMRDLLPAAGRSTYLGRRLAFATAGSALVSLAAGFAVTAYLARGGGPATGYTAVLATGALFGLAGVWFLSRVPEPIQRPIRRRPLTDILIVPLRDAGFRAVLLFLAVWNFAASMASPFFAVYELRTLGLTLGAVVVLTLITQGANVLFFGVWGALADRFGNRRVLQLSGPLFMLSLLAWPFTREPHLADLQWPLLILIHVLVGMSAAGVTLCTGAIALKSAPRGHATAYLATNALVSGAAAILAPLAAGVAADRLAGHRLTIGFSWSWPSDPIGSPVLAGVALEGLDFVFLGALAVGLYALHLLATVREEGEAARRIAIHDVYGEVLKALREIPAAPGLRQLTAFPYGLLQLVRERRRRARGPSIEPTSQSRTGSP